MLLALLSECQPALEGTWDCVSAKGICFLGNLKFVLLLLEFFLCKPNNSFWAVKYLDTDFRRQVTCEWVLPSMCYCSCKKQPLEETYFQSLSPPSDEWIGFLEWKLGNKNIVEFTDWNSAWRSVPIQKFFSNINFFLTCKMYKLRLTFEKVERRQLGQSCKTVDIWFFMQHLYLEPLTCYVLIYLQ